MREIDCKAFIVVLKNIRKSGDGFGGSLDLNIWYHFSKQVEATKIRYLQSQIAKKNSWKLLEHLAFSIYLKLQTC